MNLVSTLRIYEHFSYAPFSPNREANIMNRRRILSLIAVGVIGFSAPGIARADEILKFRMFTRAVAVQSMEVGDVDGHSMYLGHFAGLALFSDGSLGAGKLTFTGDYTKGAGTFSTYFNATLKDGSTLWWKGSGQGKPDGTTTVFPEFPITVVRGTDKFEGAKGEGTQTGLRMLPQPSAGADLFVDVTLNLTK
jgi:hypothetical protein